MPPRPARRSQARNVRAREALLALVLVAAGGLLLTAAAADPGSRGPHAPDGAAGEPAQPPADLSPPSGSVADADGDEPPPLATQPAVLPDYHEVEAGETLSSIARRYGLAAAELARSNAVDDARTLAVGTRLVLPDPAVERPARIADARAADHPAEAVLEEVAAEFGWRPATVKAVAWVESRWTQTVVSPEGAVGVMQVRPATGEKMAARLGRDLELYDLRDNVTAGVAYLDLLYERYDGDLRATLAAYHQGPTSLARTGVLPASERYVDAVLDMRARFDG